MGTEQGPADADPRGRGDQQTTAPAEYIAFFRDRYRDVVRATMYVGASRDQAEEATANAMLELLQRWDHVEQPYGYARRAAISRFLKDKMRDLDRVRRRMVERSAYPALDGDDPDLTVWEDREWVAAMLDSLHPRQRDVMAFIVDGYKPIEIAALLGRSPDAVRQSLCAARRELQQRLQAQRLEDSQGHEGPAGPARKEVEQR